MIYTFYESTTLVSSFVSASKRTKITPSVQEGVKKSRYKPKAFTRVHKNTSASSEDSNFQYFSIDDPILDNHIPKITVDKIYITKYLIS